MTTETPHLADELRRSLARQALTIEQLVAAADALLARLVPKQTRHKVRQRPDVRTIRYYVSTGLLPKPANYAGGRARYSGTHLLRLVLVKRLQAEHQTLRAIRSRLAAASDEDVLRDLLQPGAGAPGAGAPPAARLRLVGGETAAPSTPRSVVVRRFVLSAGASLDLLEEGLADPRWRLAVAEKMEEIVRWLRAPDTDGDAS